MALKAEYIIGKKSIKEWSGVYGYKPEAEEDLSYLGSMYAVARISTGTKTFPSEKFAKLIIDELQQAYFHDLKEIQTLKRLEEATWKMKSRMDLILTREEELAEVGVDMEMAIVVFVKDIMYVLVIGESYVLIERDGEIVNIAEALIDTNKSGFLRSGSLEIVDSDKFVIATSRSFNTIDDIKESFTSLTISLLDAEGVPGGSLMMIADKDLEWDSKKPIEEDIQELENDEEQVVEVGQDASQDSFEESVLSHEMEDQLGDMVSDKLIVDTQSDALNNFDTKEIDHANNPQSHSDSLDTNQDDYDYDHKSIGSDSVNALSLADRLTNLYQKIKLIGMGILTSLSTKVAKFTNKREEILSNDRNDEFDSDVYKNSAEKSNTSKYHEILSSLISKLKIAVLKVVNHFRENQTTYIYYVRNFLSRITHILFNLRKYFRKYIIGRSDDRRVIDRRTIKRNRWLFGILVILLAVFLFNQFQNVRTERAEKERVELATQKVGVFESRLGEIKTAVSTAQFNENVNKQSIVAQINQLEQDVQTFRASTELFPDKQQLILNDLSAQMDILLNRVRLDANNVYIDVSTKYSDVNLTDLEEQGGQLFISDDAQNVVYKLNKLGTANLAIHISNVVGPYNLVEAVTGEIIVYDKNAEGALAKFDGNTLESLQRFPGMPLDAIGEISGVAVFEGNNALYEIRQNHQQIFRRDRIGDEYAGGGATFNSSTPPSWKVDTELATAIDIKAPFEIYVLSEGLGLRRYLAGGPNTIDFDTFTNFNIQDFELLKNAKAFDISNFGGSDNQGVLAIGVNGNANTEGKIFLFDIIGPEKQIRFRKQLVSNASSNILNDIKSIRVDVVNNLVFILDGNRVLRAEL